MTSYSPLLSTDTPSLPPVPCLVQESSETDLAETDEYQKAQLALIAATAKVEPAA